MKKKALIYLFVVIIFLIVLMTVYYTYNQYRLRDKQQAIETRLKTMNAFIKDFHNDADRAIYIAGFRSLIAMEEYTVRQGRFFQNKTETEDVFREVFYYGTINGTAKGIMNASSFSDYESRLNVNANKLDIYINVNVTKIDLNQTNPWNIDVIIYALVNITDGKKLAYWLYNKTFVTSVPVYDIRDPLYTVNTLGKIQTAVKQTAITDFVNNSNNNTNNLQLHLNNSYYKASDKAPSFLMRFYNDTSNNTYGIESMVNFQLLSDQGIVVMNRSVIDYIYFGNQSASGDWCDVQNMQNWFRIDDEHADDYELNLLNMTTC